MKPNLQLQVKTLLLFFTLILSFGTAAAICLPGPTYIAQIAQINETNADLTKVLHTTIDTSVNRSVSFERYDRAVQNYLENLSTNNKKDLENKTYNSSNAGIRHLKALQDMNVAPGEIIVHKSPSCGENNILIYTTGGTLQHGYLSDGFRNYFYLNTSFNTTPGVKRNCPSNSYTCEVYTDITFQNHSFSIAKGQFATFENNDINAILLQKSRYWKDEAPSLSVTTEVSSHLYIDFNNKTLAMEELGSEVETFQVITRDEVWISPWRRFRNFIISLFNNI